MDRVLKVIKVRKVQLEPQAHRVHAEDRATKRSEERRVRREPRARRAQEE